MLNFEKRILCVDDEPYILEGLKRQLNNKFEIHTASSGEEGLNILRNQGPFSVVISDCNMPSMDGATFLSEVQNINPNTTRILLTGESDINIAASAVNKGQVFHYLVKPCKPEILINTLNDAIQKNKQLIQQNKKLDRLKCTEEVNEKLSSPSMQDSSIGIGNYYAMEIDLDFTHQISDEDSLEYSIVLLRIDENNSSSHTNKENIQLTKLLIESIRHSNNINSKLYRYNSKDIIMVLPKTDIETAKKTAELIKKSFNNTSAKTVSYGFGNNYDSDGLPIENWKIIVKNAVESLELNIFENQL